MTTTERDRSIAPAQPLFAADTFVSALGETWWDDAVMLGGWAIGALAFAEKAPPKLLAARLAALEDHALEARLRDAVEQGVGCDGVPDLVRPLRAAAALLHASALEAFSHAALRALQADVRDARHELRNPIGTIRNAVSMLREASEANLAGGEEAAGDRLHGIALRGTATLETLVRDRLSDAAVADVFLGSGSSAASIIEQVVDAVSPRARAAGIALSPTGTTEPVTVRALGLDLVLRSLVVAGVRAAASGSRVHVELLPGDEGAAWLRVRPEHPAHARPELLDGTRELAERARLALSGELEGKGVCVEARRVARSGRQ